MEDNNKEYELVVAQGKIPLWKLVIAAIFYTYIIYRLYLLGTFLYDVEFDKMPVRVIPNTIKSVCFCLVAGISFSISKTVLIDLDKDKLISRYAVGPFSRDVLTVVPSLEYISVFFNSKEEYEVNLWYTGNKHYNMYVFNEKEPAFTFAIKVSDKLNIDLLDATSKGNNKWVEKDKL